MEANIMNKQRDERPEYVRMYYEHQYNRMAKLEDQTLAITNVVIAMSILALTFGFTRANEITMVKSLGVPVMIIIANMFAIGYIKNSHRFIGLHQKRAITTLERFAIQLFELNQEIPWPTKDAWKGRRTFHILLHIALALAALLPVIEFIVTRSN